MYIVFIILILIAAVLLVLTVLAQNPKSGMAANFGASNQVMGVRQTADFLEKLTWGLSTAILVFSLCATMTMPSANIQRSKADLERAIIESGAATPGNNVLPNNMGDISFDTEETAPAAEEVPVPAEQTAPATEE